MSADARHRLLSKTDPLLIGDYPNVVVLEGLRDKLVVAQPVITRSVNGRPLAVAVPVRRTSWTGDIPIQYRFEFYDADMRPLEPMPDWQVMTMSQAQVLLRGNALDDTAANWRLVLRPAR
ncbi:MAG: hypothetical protein HC898_00595 [Phycisphaerales bacterium]|nr:hypothetical protein [Phycisphaerales bacterium]